MPSGPFKVSSVEHYHAINTNRDAVKVGLVSPCSKGKNFVLGGCKVICAMVLFDTQI